MWNWLNYNCGMMRLIRCEVPVLFMVFFWLAHGATKKREQIFKSLDEDSLCTGTRNSKTVVEINKNTDVIISGKSGNLDGKYHKDCNIRLSLDHKDKNLEQTNARLVVHFNYIFINDCGVKLQVNESLVEEGTNHEIYMSQCQTVNPTSVYARPKHSVIIRLMRQVSTESNFNFRVNVSRTDDLPDSSGVALYKVIIVVFVVLVVVLCAIYLMLKYLVKYLDTRWRDHRSQEAMTRAISIYNSNSQEQQVGQESDMMYVEPGTETSSDIPRRNGASPEIAFVHSDGRLERFRTTAREQSYQSPSLKAISRKHNGLQSNTDGVPSTKPKPNRTPAEESPLAMLEIPLIENRRSRLAGLPLGGVVEAEGTSDLPPSYEEALDMPGPSLSLGATSEDVDNLSDLEAEGGVISPRGLLRIDYVNILSDRGQQAELRGQGDQGVDGDSLIALPSAKSKCS